MVYFAIFFYYLHPSNLKTVILIYIRLLINFIMKNNARSKVTILNQRAYNEDMQVLHVYQ